MDFTAAGTDLEQQAAQLLLKLHVTTNPAFTEEIDGTTDEELMIKADPFTAAAKRNHQNSNNSSMFNSNAYNSALTSNTSFASNNSSFHHHQNSRFGPSAGNASFDELTSSATSAAVAANANFMAALSSASSRRRKPRVGGGIGNNNNNNMDSDDDQDPHNTNSHHHSPHSAASFEIEAFRVALKQQRVPSLRLLVAVSRSAVPALMCALCNAQAFNSVDELCSGGRFDSLYYDAKFRTAREHEKRKQKDRAQQIEERRHCLFRPRNKEEIGAELIARKRGEVYVDPKEVALAEKEANSIDRRDKSLRMPNQQNSKSGGQQDGENKNDEKDADGESKKKEGDGEKEEAQNPEDMDTEMAKEPDAFFNYNMQWKEQRKRKMDKKIAKLKKEREDEEEETFRQWEMSKKSQKLAATYREKKEKGQLLERTITTPYTFAPVTTPYKSKRNDTVALDVIERLQMDVSKRKEDQILREVEEIGKYRAKTPRIQSSKVKEVVSELHHPTPKKTTTFRKAIPVEEPTFSPKISRGPRASTPTVNKKQQQQPSSTLLHSDLSRERHSRKCITPYAVSKAQLRALQVKPITDEEATARYRRNMDAMREREERLQEIRDQIENKKAAECTFQNADLVDTKQNERLTSSYYAGLEDDMMNLSKIEQQKETRRSLSRKRATTPSPSPSSPNRRNLVLHNNNTTNNNNNNKKKKEFSPPHLTPSRRLEIPNRACGTDGMSPERRRRVANNDESSPSKKNSKMIETQIATNPADQQSMLQTISEYFNDATMKRKGQGPLLPLSHSIDLCHRIAVEKRITVSRILKWEDVQLIFPAVVSFVDFVKLFEIMVGSSLTKDFL